MFEDPFCPVALENFYPVSPCVSYANTYFLQLQMHLSDILRMVLLMGAPFNGMRL